MQISTFAPQIEQWTHARMNPRVSRYVVRLSSIFVVYLGTALIAPALYITAKSTPALCIPAAIAMAALLLFGREMWPAIFAGALSVGILRGTAPLPSLGIAVGNTIEPLLGVALLNWAGLARPSFWRLRDVRLFIAAAFVGPAAAAIFWIVFQHAVLGVPLSAVPHSLWVRGHGVSVLLIVPMFLAWKEPLIRKLGIASLGMAAAALAALTAVDALIFSVSPSNSMHTYVVGYIIFPALMWIALQFGPQGAALGLLVTGMVAVSNTLGGRGPFAMKTDPILAMHIFLAVLGMTTLTIAATICEHRQTEDRLRRNREQLRESEARYRDVVENAQDFIVTLDPQGNFTSANRAVVEASSFSKDELLSKNIFELITPSSLELAKAGFKEVLGGKERSGTQLELQRKGGGSLWIEVNSRRIEQGGAVVGIQSIGRDISWRRRVEEQLLQSQKMEAVARLAGGVAHDFNNLLGVIIGYSDLLLEEFAANETLRKRIAEIKKAGRRAAEVTRQLLAFSRKQALFPRVVELNSIVNDTARMLLRLLGEDIELSLNLSPVSPLTKVDPAQMQQVIINLAINARDAMPHGGRMILETATATLDETSHQGVTVIPGKYAVLAITDTGMGMDEATRARIFEPFFSTKEEQGTGLGLATVYGFVRQSGGYIWVYSEVGHGTTFKIYLPQSMELLATEIEDDGPQMALPGGTETILLAEDAESLRELNLELLQALGYTVIEAAHGMEALDKAAQYGDPIHVLLTDVVMPGMSGKELAERLELLRPGTKVIYMSGYTDHVILQSGILKSGTAFLQKPFTRETLARKLREVLGASDSYAGDQREV